MLNLAKRRPLLRDDSRMSNISFKNNTESKIPRIFFGRIKDAILGKNYSLSVAYVEEAEIAKLNLIYREKNKPTDILSFPLSENEGQIIICPKQVIVQAPDFNRQPDNFTLFLFIHGCVHLKGYDHGSKMESMESQFRKQFGI